MPFLDRLRQEKLEPEDVGYVKGEENRLIEQLRYVWERRKLTFTCPVATVSDGASIPELIPDIILNDHGRISKPSYPHDVIYKTYLRSSKNARTAWEKIHGVWTKAEADLMFHDGMVDEKMHWLRAAGAYIGVRGNLKAAYLWGKK